MRWYWLFFAYKGMLNMVYGRGGGGGWGGEQQSRRPACVSAQSDPLLLAYCIG